MRNLVRYCRFKRLLFICAISLSAIIANQSCTKIETSAPVKQVFTDAELNQKFFDMPANTPISVRRVVASMKEKNNNSEFVKRFINNNGYPSWQNAIVQTKRHIAPSSFTANAVETDTTVIIPVVQDDSNVVSSFIKARLADSVSLNLYRGGDYSAYSFNDVPSDSINADKAALQMMYLNYKTFGYTQFLIADNRLFSNDALVDTSKPKRLYVIKSIDEPQSFLGESNLLIQIAMCVDWYVYTDGSWCDGLYGSTHNRGGSDPESNIIPHPHCSTYAGTECYSYWVDTGGGGGGDGGSTGSGPGDGGGTGGGSGNPPGFPCASSQGKNIGIADPCGSNPIPPPIIPAPHNVIVQVVTNTINPNFPCLVSAYSNITKPRLTNCLYQLYDETFVGTGSVHNLEITSSAQVVANGAPVPAASRVKPGDANTYQIFLNESEGMAYTREYWSSIILHELVHGFIQKNNLDFSPATQFTNAHEIMLKNWVDEMKNMLKEIYPSMSDTDALCLAINGMSDVLAKSALDPAVESQMETWMQQHYSIDVNTLGHAVNRYIMGLSGTPCS